jgi:hypothetical protein
VPTTPEIRRAGCLGCAAVSFQEQVAAIARDQGVGVEERALLEQDVVTAEPLGEGLGANEVWRLELGFAREGAYFKPVNGVNATLAHYFGHTRESVLISELGAYRLAASLGSPFAELVPACVVRLVPDVDADAPGSLMAERFDDRSGNLFEIAPADALKAAFFDALIGNQDRSRANLLFDPSRADLALIDHGFAFPREHDLQHAAFLVEWRRRAGLDELADIEIAALERLLGADELMGLARYLEPDRADALARRAAGMRAAGRLA